MTKREAQRYVWLCEALKNHGITQDEVDTLLRCSRTLHTWAEHECNGDIERDETTGKTYRVHEISTEQPLTLSNDSRDFGTVRRWDRKRYPTPDREKGALRRVFLICAYHKLGYYHQGDPRGCCLYLLRPGDVPTGSDPGSYYSNGIAICID
jgi:hypothetical protein